VKMKNRRDHKYSEIASFEDFGIEKERLTFRSKLTEAKLTITYLEISKLFSVSSMLFSVAKEVVLPKISDFLNDLVKKAEKEAFPEASKSQE
jgi:hypothetical protein